MKPLATHVVIFFSLIVASSCGKEYTPDTPHHYLGHSEFLADSLKITVFPNYKNLIKICLLEDDIKRSSYQEAMHLSFWGYHGEEYNMTLGRSLNAFSDRKLSAVFPQSEDFTVRYWTSLVTDKVTITSKHSLFGEIPGEDISEHFTRCIQKGISWDCLNKTNILKSDDYAIAIPCNEPKPESIAKFFFPGYVLMSSSGPFDIGCDITLKENPTKPCKSTVITINIPVKDTFYLDAFDMSGNFDESKVTHRNRVLKGSVKIDF